MTGAAVLVGGVLLYFLAKKLWASIPEDALNPLSDKNAAYTGVNNVGEAVTGEKDWSLGGAIFDWIHGEYDPNAPVKLQSRKQAVGDQFYDTGILGRIQ